MTSRNVAFAIRAFDIDSSFWFRHSGLPLRIRPHLPEISPRRTFPAMLKRTPFYDFHVSHGAKIVEYAGWEMPIMYRSIIDEHQQTRNSGSIFDVSHMGRVHFTGKDAARFLNHV